MKEYFLIKHLPELADLPKNERDRLRRENYFKGLRHWQPWAAFVVLIIWSMIVFVIIDYLRDEVFRQKHIIFSIAYGVLGFGLGYIFFWITWVKKVRLHI